MWLGIRFLLLSIFRSTKDIKKSQRAQSPACPVREGFLRAQRNFCFAKISAIIRIQQTSNTIYICENQRDLRETNIRFKHLAFLI